MGLAWHGGHPVRGVGLPFGYGMRLSTVAAGLAGDLVGATGACGAGVALRQRLEDSGRDEPVGPTLRVSRAGRAGALPASDRQ